MKSNLCGVVALAAALSLANFAQGETINGVSYLDGVSINAYSSYLTEYGQRAPANTVNGSGLTAATGMHDVTETDMWMTVGNNGWNWSGVGPRQPDTLPGAYIIYDLGSLYNLTDIHVWNWNAHDDDVGYGVKGVLISASATTTFGTGAAYTFAKASGAANYMGADYAFSASGVRYVKFEIQSNYSADHPAIPSEIIDLAGLAEVRFQGTTIPEPSTLAIMAGGLLGLIAYAWRKRR